MNTYNEIADVISERNTLQKRVDLAIAEVNVLRNKLTSLQRSMQQIANLDPTEFNSSAKAVQMAKTALLIPIPKK